MHPSPNILRSDVIGCEAKYELAIKRSKGGIFSEIEVFWFLVKKMVMYYIKFQTVETEERQTK